MFPNFGWPHAERGGDETLALLLLTLLEEKMDTAVELVKRLEARFGGRAVFDASDVYPMLQYLEDRGFVAQEPLGAGKVYAVTEAGFAHKAEQERLREEARTQAANQPEEGPRAGWGGHHGRHGHHWRHGHHGRGPWGERGPWPFDHESHRQVHELFREVKHLMRSFKHALRSGRLTPERMARIQAIFGQTRRDIDDVLNGPADQGTA